MRLSVLAITFAITIGGLFLFENYKTPAPEQNYAKIVSELQQSASPTTSPQPTKALPILVSTPSKQQNRGSSIFQPNSTNLGKIGTSPTPSPSPIATPTPKTYVYYTSSASQAKSYYCDTDYDWKNLSKANLKQFSSSDELLVSYPSRTLHEPCR